MSNDFWQTIGDFVAAEMRGAEQERERIIKLLEENFNRFDASNNQVDYMSLTDFIALIKGEQK
jgi:hypothetical protein